MAHSAPLCHALEARYAHQCTISTKDPIVVKAGGQNAAMVQNWFTREGRRHRFPEADNVLCSAVYLVIVRDACNRQHKTKLSPQQSLEDNPRPLNNLQERCDAHQVHRRIMTTTEKFKKDSETWRLSEPTANTGDRAQLFVKGMLAFIFRNEAELGDWPWQWIFPETTITPQAGEVPFPYVWRSVDTFSKLADLLVPSIVDCFSDDLGYSKDIPGTTDILTASSPIQDALSTRLIVVLLQGMQEIKPSTMDPVLLDLAEKFANTLDVCLVSLERRNTVVFGAMAVLQTYPQFAQVLVEYMTLSSDWRLTPVCCRILTTLVDIIDVFDLKLLKTILIDKMLLQTDNILQTISQFLGESNFFITVIVPLAKVVAKLNMFNHDISCRFFTRCIVFARTALMEVHERVKDLNRQAAITDEANATNVAAAAAAKTRAVKNKPVYFQSVEVVCTQSRSLLVIISEHCNKKIRRALESDIQALEKDVESCESPANRPFTIIRRQLTQGNPFGNRTFDEAFETIEQSTFVRDWLKGPPAPLSSNRTPFHRLSGNGDTLRSIRAMCDRDLDIVVNQLVGFSLAADGAEPSSDVDEVIETALETLGRTVQSFRKIDPRYQTPIGSVPMRGPTTVPIPTSPTVFISSNNGNSSLASGAKGPRLRTLSSALRNAIPFGKTSKQGVDTSPSPSPSPSPHWASSSSSLTPAAMGSDRHPRTTTFHRRTESNVTPLSNEACLGIDNPKTVSGVDERRTMEYTSTVDKFESFSTPSTSSDTSSNSSKKADGHFRKLTKTIKRKFFL
ncbi:hypothetical protein BC936DRAFT_137992 [Jimgerdemannia flammicorona]|uniref:Uncharacterized protein n=1 Tax=Jimgerdemannia flammicorona TaxID=994334 RepID=A0A433CW13_9FUNG|nr:hypothetical protein BC936DRAFT_137992 [Jimgerdemannia flammicorona]